MEMGVEMGMGMEWSARAPVSSEIDRGIDVGPRGIRGTLTPPYRIPPRIPS